MLLIKPLAVSAAILFATGCASIISKSEYGVNVNSDPQGQRFEIKNEAGRHIHTGETPETVTLDAGAGFFDGERYTLSTDGSTVILDSVIDGWYFGNLIFGGILGMLIIDPATGAMYSLPEEVHLGE